MESSYVSERTEGNWLAELGHDPSVELDHILEDQPAPTVSTRLHKQSTFGKPAKFDRRETEIPCERGNFICGAVIVARQEHDSPAAMYRRILVKDGGNRQVVGLAGSRAGSSDENLGVRLKPDLRTFVNQISRFPVLSPNLS
jgi:hypothetical protein